MPRKRKQQKARVGESLYQRSQDGRWCAPFVYVHTDGTKKRYVPTGRTRVEAEDARARKRAELEAATPAKRESPTLGAWLQTWLRDWKEPNCRATTIANYQSWVRACQPVEATLVADLTTGQLQAFLVELHKRSASMAHNVRRALIDALNVAMDDNLIGFNPAKRTKLPAYVPKRYSLTADQVRSLFAAIEGDRYGIAVWLGLESLRRGEAADLRWDDIDLDAGVIRVTHQRTIAGADQEVKTKRSKRRVHATPQTVAALRAHKAAMAEEALAQGRPLAPTVLSRPDGTPLPLYTLGRWYNAVKERLGLPGVFHSLRRTHATLAQQAGAQTRNVMAQMGHAAPDQTIEYTDPTDEGQRDAAERLGSVLPWPKTGS